MNVYYDPSAFGLTIVAELDASQSYEFDQVVVWRDQAGKIWAAHDSGCSCPTPFGETAYPADMQEIRQLDDIRPVIAELSSWPNAAEVFDFLAKVRAAL